MERGQTMKPGFSRTKLPRSGSPSTCSSRPLFFHSPRLPSRKSSRRRGSLAPLSSCQLFPFISCPARKRFSRHTADSVRVSSAIIMKNIVKVQFPGKYDVFTGYAAMFEVPRGEKSSGYVFAGPYLAGNFLGPRN